MYNLEFREKLVGLAIKWEGLDWLYVGKLRYMYDPELGRERAVSVALEDLNRRYKHLKFVEYDMNGADDVVNWEKVIWARKKHEFRKMIDEDGKEAPVRFVTIPRHKGDNISLIKLL